MRKNSPARQFLLAILAILAFMGIKSFIGDEDKGKAPSRFYELYDLIGAGDRHKTVFMLTATPINNRLAFFICCL